MNSFCVCLKEKPFTRRGVLSTVSSLYDPLGFIAPVLLSAKILLQDLCRRKFGWDEPFCREDERVWSTWLQELPELASVAVPRCIQATGVSYASLKSLQLHHFAAASTSRSGVVTYPRTVSCNEQIHCAFLFGKARLAPIKTVSVPRLELTAATLVAKINGMIKRDVIGRL